MFCIPLIAAANAADKDTADTVKLHQRDFKERPQALVCCLQARVARVVPVHTYKYAQHLGKNASYRFCMSNIAS